jgi:hypothetical protein
VSRLRKISLRGDTGDDLDLVRLEVMAQLARRD